LISMTVMRCSQNSAQTTHIKNIHQNRKKFPLNVAYLLIITILFLMGGCASLPPNSANPETYALQDTTDTRLAKNTLNLKKVMLINRFFCCSVKAWMPLAPEWPWPKMQTEVSMPSIT